MRVTAGIACLMMLAACASGQVLSRSVDPVGSFDFTTSIEGTPVAGTITITQNASGYGGTLSTDMTDSMPISSVSVDGQTMVVVSVAPDGTATLSLTFTGDTFTGSWSFADMSGTLTGRRRAG